MRIRKAKPPLIAFFADPHTGSNTALMPKSIVNDDDQLITASPVQLWLLENFEKAKQEMYERAKGRSLIVVVNGDLIDGNHHGSTQIIPNTSDQIKAAVELWEPVRHRANRFYIVRGTEAHVGEAAQDEKTIATELGADGCHWELLVYWNDQLFNIAHHISRTIASVTEECVRDSVDLKEPVPDWVIRAHRHIKDDTGTRYGYTRGVVLPAWQLRTGFGFRVSSHRVSSIGFAMVDDRELIMRSYTAPRHILREAEYNAGD